MSQDTQNQTMQEGKDEFSIYELFILALSILSLLVILVIYLPFVANTETAIAYDLDFILSLIFLADFIHRLYQAPDRKRYFKSAGWIDLAGSIPFFPIFRLFRVARALRTIRIARRMGGREVLRYYKENGWWSGGK
jgi:voltage-gated potassium channel